MYNIIITAWNDLSFEWDPSKAESNLSKHGVSFEEATSVFYDLYARVIDDPTHSIDEERFVILGLSAEANVLTVCHCYRSNDSVIRIISARRATKSEASYYWRLRNGS